MNRTKIEWCDYSWNPVTGCRHGCSYCYARRMANRFQRSFEPMLHPERLEEPKKVRKPSRIFVCSNADLLGAWVPTDWIRLIRDTVLACSWHSFIFLTKNPARYAEFNPWPRNVWLGTTITNQPDFDERAPELFKAQARVLFMSHEPLLGRIDVRDALHLPTGWSGASLSWGLIGAMTGAGAIKPEPYWVRELIDQYHGAGKPVFVKDNLGWPEKIQEWPS